MNTLLLLLALLGQPSCNAKIEFPEVAGLPGDVVEVSVRGQSTECLTAAYAVAIGYDQSKLKFLSAEPGAWLLSYAPNDFLFASGEFPTMNFCAFLAIYDLRPPIDIPPAKVPPRSELGLVRFRIFPEVPSGTVVDLINEPRQVPSGAIIDNAFAGPGGQQPVKPELFHGKVLVGAQVKQGDCNQDGRFDIGDAIFSLRYLFGGGETPHCKNACEANGDDRVDLSDAIYFLNYQFAGGSAPLTHVTCGGAL